MTAPLLAESTNLSVVATLGPGTKCTVCLFPLGHFDTPVAVEKLDLAASVSRERLTARLATDLQVEAAGLLERLAAIVAAEQTKPRSRSAVTESGTNLPYQPTEFAEDPQDGAEVLASIHDTIKRYVWIGEPETVFLSLWVLHTYALDVADHTPYAHISAPVKQCGKSTLQDVLAGLVAKGVRVSNMSPAFLFRVLDASSPTLLIDEVSAWLNGPNAGELRGILNDGFQRNGRVGRVDSSSKGGDKEFHPTYFRVWGAKAFSGIGRDLSDELLDRCVPVRLARASDAERVHLVKLRNRKYQSESTPLRARCARWVADALPTLRVAHPHLPESLSGRQQDIWEPLFAIADAIGADVGVRAREASITLHDRPSLGLGEQLLADLLEVFINALPPSGFVSTDALLQRLNERDDRPWCEMPGTHRPLSARGLSSMLKHFEIEHHRPRGDGPRGYQVAAFVPAWNQYLSEPEARERLAALQISGTSGTSGTLSVPGVPEVPDHGRVDESKLTPTAEARTFVSPAIGDDTVQLRLVI